MNKSAPEDFPGLLTSDYGKQLAEPKDLHASGQDSLRTAALFQRDIARLQRRLADAQPADRERIANEIEALEEAVECSVRLFHRAERLQAEGFTHG